MAMVGVMTVMTWVVFFALGLADGETPMDFPLVDHMNCWGNHHCFSTSFSMLTLYVYFRVAGNGRSSCGT